VCVSKERMSAMKTDDIRTCMRVAREHGINCGGALDDFAAYGGAVIELSALEADNAQLVEENLGLRTNELRLMTAVAALEADNARMRKALDITEHDTKEPIRSIRFYLKLIDDLGSLDEEHAAYLQAAIRSIDGIESALKAALTSKPLDTTNHCPLCEGYAVHVAELEADNARMRKALDGLCRAIEHGDENRYAIVVQDGRKALLPKIQAALTGSPAGAFVTLEDLRKIEWADENEIAGIEHCYCPACHGLEQDGHRADCWLDAKIKEAEDADN